MIKNSYITMGRHSCPISSHLVVHREDFPFGEVVIRKGSVDLVRKPFYMVIVFHLFILIWHEIAIYMKM